jgi:hypothetical protein
MLSYKTVLLALLFSSSTLALPIHRREVPQEHSHEQFLTSVRTSLAKNNPLGIVDPVFALLGAAAAQQGLGKLTDTDCLQQATADQAFTNAKADNDVKGMVDALIYRSLERNSASVGATTKPCTSIKAVNPEIAAIQQHQDAASENANEVNKAIEIELAKQIAAVGGDPLDALLSATFAPGKIGDPTAKGNSCDDANDPVGCGISQNLIVPAASEADIKAAVAGAGNADNGNADNQDNASDGGAADSTCPPPVTVTVTAGASDATSTADDSAATSTAADTTTTAADASATSGSGSGTNIGDFGKCSIPQIEFAVGFDNRRETSFQPVDKTSFNHGSAQAIGIITQFICDTLTNSCGADDTAKATCKTAQAAAAAQTPKRGIDADAFNAVFGIKTNFRDVTAVDDQGRDIADSTGGNVDVADVASGSAPKATATGNLAVVTGAPAASGANLQKFTGALGDAKAPAVTVGGRGFVVEGSDDFLNVGAALGRSCDIQHNACANKANSGGGFSVSACDAQNNDCHAAI